MEQTKLEKIAETFKDEAFAKRIAKIKEKDELIKAFAGKGLELSMAEIDELVKKGREIISSGKLDQIKEALSEDKLENISGGGKAKEFAEGLGFGLFPVIMPLINNGPPKDSFEIGLLVGFTALTLAAAPTVYKGVKAAGKGIYKAGSKVYNKITGSNNAKES